MRILLAVAGIVLCYAPVVLIIIYASGLCSYNGNC